MTSSSWRLRAGGAGSHRHRHHHHNNPCSTCKGRIMCYLVAIVLTVHTPHFFQSVDTIHRNTECDSSSSAAAAMTNPGDNSHHTANAIQAAALCGGGGGGGGGAAEEEQNKEAAITATPPLPQSKEENETGSMLAYAGPDKNISNYDAFLYPVIRNFRGRFGGDEDNQHNGRKKVMTRLFIGTELNSSAHAKHMIVEGLVRSEFFDLDQPVQVVTRGSMGGDVTPAWLKDDLWVIDATHMTKACGHMTDLLQRALEQRHREWVTNQWDILMVDFWDKSGREAVLWECVNRISTMLQDCPEPKKCSLRYAKRSLTINTWDRRRRFPRLGPFLIDEDHGSGPVLHIPYSVRTDIAIAVHGIANGTHPVDTVRESDVSHYYRKQGRGYFDKLRLSINELLVELNGTAPFENVTSSSVPPRAIRAHTGVKGHDGEEGRRLAQDAYVEHMMQTKIIVVAQRDGWSDHWRLFEALATGALVMHDLMNVLPRGLRHGENIIIYQDLTQLREQILYYLHPNNERERLRIARNGWEMAMGYHRSWHSMETVIFGRPMTQVGNTSIL